MKKFGKILFAFAFMLLCFAVPLTVTGCDKEEEDELGTTIYTVTFNIKHWNEYDHEVSSGAFGKLYIEATNQLVPESGIQIREGSKFSVSNKKQADGRTFSMLTIGTKKIKAVPERETFGYSYFVRGWDYAAKDGVDNGKVVGDVVVDITFQREPQTYRVIFDANTPAGKHINEELPTNYTWTYGKALGIDGVNTVAPQVTMDGYHIRSTTSGNVVNQMGWSFDPDVTTGLPRKSSTLVDDYNSDEKYPNRQIDVKNKTIKLFAIWVEQCVKVNICHNVTEWKTNGDPKTYTMINVPDDFKVALYVENADTGEDECVYDYDYDGISTTNGVITFHEIELYNAEERLINYKIYAQKSLTDDTLVYTGINTKANYSNGSIANVSSYLDYVDVVLEKDENVASVTGAGTYLRGTEVSVTAVITDANYTFDKWTKLVPHEGDDPTVETVSTQVTYTFELDLPVTYTANAKLKD